MRKLPLFFFGFFLAAPLSFSEEKPSSGMSVVRTLPVWKVRNYLVPGFSSHPPKGEPSDPHAGFFPISSPPAVEEVARLLVSYPHAGFFPISKGNGFFIGPRLFIASLHAISKFPVTNDYLVNHFPLFRFTRLEQSEFVIRVKRVIRVSSALGLALLETEGAVDSYLPLDASPLDPAENVWIYAYPGAFGSPQLKAITKTGEAMLFEGGGIGFLTDYHGSLARGSGSPLLDDQGRVRGALYSGISHFALATTGQDLKDFVEGNKGLDCFSNHLGKCMEEDREQLRQSAEAGDVLSQRSLGFLMYKANQQRSAQKWLERAARQDDPIAQYIMGLIDRKGRKLHWFSQAVGHNFIPAKHVLADYFFKIRQKEKAVELLMESARSGYMPSIKKLNQLGFYTPLSDPLSRFQFAMAYVKNRCYSLFYGK